MLTFSLNKADETRQLFVDLIREHGAKKASIFVIDRLARSRNKSKVRLDKREFLFKTHYVEQQGDIKGKGRRFVEITEDNDLDASHHSVSSFPSLSTPDFQDTVVDELESPEIENEFIETLEYEQFKFWWEGVRNYVLRKVEENNGESVYLERGSRTWALESQEIVKSVELITSFLDKIGYDNGLRTPELMEVFLKRLSIRQDEIVEPLTLVSWQEYKKNSRASWKKKDIT